MSAPSGPIRTLGIFGAGKSGVAIARRALAAGYQVRIATSGPAWRTGLVTSILTPGATAENPEDLSRQSDAVILAVPLRRFRELPLRTLEDRLVIDVMNYWAPTDGVLPEFEADTRASSEIIRDALPASTRLVKTLNHIGYHEIEELARPAGTPDRVAVAVAGDDPESVNAVTNLIDDIGFTPVIAGRLALSHALQPGSPVFGADYGEAQMRHQLTGLHTASTTS